jgi:hypothetical protein
MDISSLTSATQIGSQSSNPNASLAQFKAQSGSQMLSLIPAVSSSPGLGLNVDIYAAVGAQAQGALSGGRTALEIASISLGIDMKQSSVLPGDEDLEKSTTDSSASSSTGSTDSSGSQASASDSTGTKTATQRNAILEQILKQDGYVAPDPDPYVLQKDFFSGTTSSTAIASASYADTDPANPDLGGTLDSLA